MSYNHTYAQIKDILKSSKKMTKDKMLQIAKLAIIETLGSELHEICLVSPLLLTIVNVLDGMSTMTFSSVSCSS